MTLLLAWIYYEFIDNPRSTALSPDAAKELAKIEKELTKLRTRLFELRKEGRQRDLKINIDGTYHRGSKLGVELNEIFGRLGPKETALSDASAAYRYVPIRILNNWKNVQSIRVGFRFAVPAYVIIFVMLFFLRPDAVDLYRVLR